MFTKVENAGVAFYESPLLRKLGIPHAFSTRCGGVSSAPFDTLNLGNPRGSKQQDAEENIASNYRRFLEAAGLSGRFRCWIAQVHGADIFEVSSRNQIAESERADGLVTSLRDVVLTIRYADCAPILLADASTGRVAAVHAGWRGTVTGVIENAVRAFSSPTDIFAAIGPCLGSTTFEVGPEVIDAFHRTGTRRPVAVRHSEDRWLLDLSRTIREILVAQRVPESQIDESRLCTVLGKSDFFSYRRDGLVSGRMAALIATPGSWGQEA